MTDRMSFKNTSVATRILFSLLIVTTSYAVVETYYRYQAISEIGSLKAQVKTLTEEQSCDVVRATALRINADALTVLHEEGELIRQRDKCERAPYFIIHNEEK